MGRTTNIDSHFRIDLDLFEDGAGFHGQSKMFQSLGDTVQIGFKIRKVVYRRLKWLSEKTGLSMNRVVQLAILYHKFPFEDDEQGK